MVSIAALLFALSLLVQLPGVQTSIVQRVVRTLDDKIDADITFEKIHFHPFRTLVVKNIAIIDKNPVMNAADSTAAPIDTLLRAEYITAKFSFESLFDLQGMHLDNVTVSNAQMNLVLEDNPDKLYKNKPQIDNLSRMFHLKKKENQKINENEIFHINEVLIEDMGFAMKNHGTKKTPYYGGINWNDLDIKDIRLEAEDLMFKGGIMYGRAEYLSFKEKSGYRMEEMYGSAKVGRGKTIVENLRINDPWSDLSLPLYMMSYENVEAFQDFIGKVKIDAEIAESHLDFKTLHHFAPQLEGNGLKAVISGSVSGHVDNFNISNIKLETEAKGFSGTVNGKLTGLPDIGNTRIEAKVNRMKMTSEGLSRFISEWMKEGSLDLSRYAEGETFLVDASARGLLNSMDVRANLYSNIGNAAARMKIENLTNPGKAVSLNGTASTEDLNLGKIISTDVLGPVTMRSGIKADLGSDINMQIDSLFIDRLNLNQYDYSGIKATGGLADNMFKGTIIASDPNLNMIIQGGFALSAKTRNSLYKFYANVTDANLNAMNIDKRGKSKIRFRTNADFTRTGDGNILGNIDIADLIFENNDGQHDIGNINLTSHSNDNINKMRLKSKFADGSYTGTSTIPEFINDILSITIKKEVPAIFRDPESRWEGDEYNFDFNTHNTMPLMAFIMPGAYIHDGTKINISIDSTGIMKAALNSQRLAIGDNYIKDVRFSADNMNNDFSSELSAQEFMFAGFSLANNMVKILADDNYIGASYSFENEGEHENRGEFVVNAGLSRINDELNVDLNLLPSAVYLSSKEWNILPSSIRMKGKDIFVDSFEIISGNERIYAHGSTSMNQEDTLSLNLDRFNISILNPLLGSNFGLKGAVSGNVSLTSPMKSPGLLADMVVDSTFFANEALGTVRIGSKWNEEAKGFDIMLRNELSGKSNINLEARLTPKKRILEGRITLDSMSVKYAEPLLADVFSDMGGFISGQIMAEGPLNRLKISSRETRLQDASLKVAFTNVPYYADGSFNIDSKGVHFNDISIRDRFNGTGSVSGGINWTDFKDINFDTRLKVNSIEAINLTREMSSDFYGNVFGTGNISITGPVDALALTVDAVTAKTGQIHIPMSNSTTAGERTDLLKFKEFHEDIYIDPYEAMRTKLAEKRKNDSDLAVKLRVDVSPNVEAFVEIDQATGNGLAGRGFGLIDLDINKDAFNINGDYTLTGGDYNFSALGIVNRQFEIQDGSSIKFSGDIMASTLDINAIYETKTSLGALLADDKSVTNRRAVECGIHITDRISNPRLTFSIEVPDLNPMIKSRVESALSTEDKVQKQFLSLLLSNSFLPDEQSGIFNNTSMLYSNVSEAMANQLSNILHKLDIPLDLGLKYQPTETGTDLFDVAVSTQLFNNRVVVNGNIGNKEYSGGETQNDVVGDIDIEIKLNRSGAFRVNLFSHSADLYSNYLDNTQRNGVGLTYQTEFNSIRQFFRNIFSNKAKRQAAKLAEEQAVIDGEKVEMKITREEDDKKDRKNGKR